MTLALFAFLAALLVALAGNSSRLVAVVGVRIGTGPQLMVPALIGPSVIIGLMFAAGMAIVPVLGHDLDRVFAAGLLAMITLLVLRPYPLLDPGEPTRSSFAIGTVVAAFSIRDGIAPLAFAAGLLADDAYAAVGLATGCGSAMVMAMRNLPPIFLFYVRYLAAILVAAAALYIGVFSI